MIDTLDLNKYFNDPIQYNCRTLFNHLGRYFYAMQKLKITKNDSVLDCSCGQGYGSYNISLNAGHVTGLDINSEYINIAKENFKSNNLDFMLYDEFFKKGLYADKIICLETIEHLESVEEIEYFIDDLLLILSPTGSMFLSFPVGNNYKSKYNKFHLCEPSIETVHNIMKKYFSRIEIETSKFINNYDKECEYCYMRGIK